MVFLNIKACQHHYVTQINQIMTSLKKASYDPFKRLLLLVSEHLENIQK